jgi:ribosomal 50S subunit-recycling heat shock protein
MCADNVGILAVNGTKTKCAYNFHTHCTFTIDFGRTLHVTYVLQITHRITEWGAM